MAELFYKKEYIANDLGSIFLKNPEPALCYIEEMVKALLETKNDGVSTTYDYLAIGFASVMLQILYDIATNDVVLGYEF